VGHALAFDLDDTLAPSKAPLPDPVVAAVVHLLGDYDVCIISGAKYVQFEQQVIARLPPEADLSRLHLMPTCGAAYFRCVDGNWVQIYADLLTPEEVAVASAAIESCARALGLWESQHWGDRIDDRGAQVTFSALGQQAPLAVKRGWDPDGVKKERLRECAQVKLPDLEVRSGGTTSVDVTRRGIDKAYGIRRFLEETGRETGDVTFFGDRLDVGGNDYPVTRLGVRCVSVHGPDDTVSKLRAYLPAD
jgi:HAD superfamily hydrolase (TIGR01484 family)